MSRFYEAIRQRETAIERELFDKVDFPLSDLSEDGQNPAAPVETSGESPVPPPQPETVKPVPAVANIADKPAVRAVPTVVPVAAPHTTPAVAPSVTATPALEVVPTVVPVAAPAPSPTPMAVPSPARSFPEYRSVSLRVPKGLPLFPFNSETSPAGEEYRMLRTNVLHHPGNPKCIAVSSAAPGDGKTITAINLAGILAMKAESRYLLIDTDMRHRSLAAALGIPESPGLSNVLAGTCSLEDAIVGIADLPGLYVLPAGDASENPAELLDSGLWVSTIAKLREQFTGIVCDTTPMAVVADFKLVQKVADGVVLVVRPGHTNRSAFQRALQIEPQSMLIGVVVNAREDWFLYPNQDGYAYKSGYTHHSTKSKSGSSRRSRS